VSSNTSFVALLKWNDGGLFVCFRLTCDSQFIIQKKNISVVHRGHPQVVAIIHALTAGAVKDAICFRIKK
jgi:hypothetical protein